MGISINASARLGQGNVGCFSQESTPEAFLLIDTIMGYEKYAQLAPFRELSKFFYPVSW